MVLYNENNKQTLKFTALLALPNNDTGTLHSALF